MQYSNKLLKLIDFNTLDYARKDLKYWKEDKLQISAELIFPKIIQYKSGYYFDRPIFKKNLKDHDLNYSDLTESEWEINEIYLLDNSNDYKILLWKAIKIMKSIKAVLQENFKGLNFNIFGFLNNPEADPSITIKFYSCRKNEKTFIKIDEINKYDEYIVALEVN